MGMIPHQRLLCTYSVQEGGGGLHINFHFSFVVLIVKTSASHEKYHVNNKGREQKKGFDTPPLLIKCRLHSTILDRFQ